MDKHCYGVAYRNNKLYVTFTENGRGGTFIENRQGCIRVLDTEGQCLSQFDSFSGTCMFHYPYYIAVDDAERMYVSENSTNNLTCLNKKGETVYNYTDSNLSSQHGVVVDGKQNAYICGSNSNNIQVIDARGNKVKTLLEKKDGIEYPRSLAYKAGENAVVVGMDC